MSMNEVMSKVVRSFSNIGKSAGTVPPASENNQFGIAAEFAIASRLRELASARYEQAKVDCINAGVLPADDPSVGTHVVFGCDGLSVVVRRNSDSSTLDKALLSTELSNRYSNEIAATIIKASSKPRKGQTVISVAIE